ncbi:MAG: hypothetical protein MK078_13515 [Crocinitomicaceae bacterium]|nr:hypothetical protein [Crocinitomicaceae bacterium]
MDHDVEIKFNQLVEVLGEKYGDGIELEGILIMIGVQELGQGAKKFSKDEKMNLMHIAICTILEPYGIYEFQENDDDGWPHFKKLKNMPPLSVKEQENFMKEAIFNYFVENKYVNL